MVSQSSQVDTGQSVGQAGNVNFFPFHTENNDTKYNK